MGNINYPIQINIFSCGVCFACYLQGIRTPLMGPTTHFYLHAALPLSFHYAKIHIFVDQHRFLRGGGSAGIPLPFGTAREEEKG